MPKLKSSSKTDWFCTSVSSFPILDKGYVLLLRGRKFYKFLSLDNIKHVNLGNKSKVKDRIFFLELIKKFGNSLEKD